MNFAPLQSGDRFLICTDGLYRELAFSKIESLLQNEQVDLAFEGLIDEALKKGRQYSRPLSRSLERIQVE